MKRSRPPAQHVDARLVRQSVEQLGIEPSRQDGPREQVADCRFDMRAAVLPVDHPELVERLRLLPSLFLFSFSLSPAPMPLAKRIIPCLDVTAGRVVKGVNFVNLRDAGDPVEIARRYDEQGADEIAFLDITAARPARHHRSTSSRQSRRRSSSP